MEVHAHTHTARKKWTHYFWEFIMLFLAVFCGFLAENKREHMIEHSREKQYIKSLVEDLRSDTTTLGLLSTANKRAVSEMNILLTEYETFATGKTSAAFIKHLQALNGFVSFSYTDRTIQQLKNAGGLRLVRNQPASDSIISYDGSVRFYLNQEAAVTRLFETTSNHFIELFNLFKLQKELKKNNNDPVSLSKSSGNDLRLTDNIEKTGGLYHYISLYNLTLDYQNKAAEELKNKSLGLINFLKKEYHLK